MRRIVTLALATITVSALAAGPAFACGGLIGARGSVNLLRTSTLAGYHDGVEHYITSFTFAGGGGEFGSITPLPGIPTKVERGGGWTLQRLARETEPVAELASGQRTAFAALDSAKVILEVQIDALDITVLEGGGDAVGTWAKDNGFRLPPDSPEVLDFYAARSPIFLAARFNADRAKDRGTQVGDGTPIHVTIPTDNPWVPLRILGLGKGAGEAIDADVYLLTDRRPALLPVPDGRGLTSLYDETASESLLTDLNADAGMGWVPKAGMWLTKLRVGGPAQELTYDLAIDASGRGRPSAVAARLRLPLTPASTSDRPWEAAAVLLIVGAAVVLVIMLSPRARRLPTG